MFGLGRWLGRGKAEPADDAPPRPSLLDYELPEAVEALLERYSEDLRSLGDGRAGRLAEPELCPTTSDIDALPPDMQCQVVLGIAKRLADSEYSRSFSSRDLRLLQSRLMRRELPFTEAQLATMLEAFPQPYGLDPFPQHAMGRAVERHVDRHGLNPRLRDALSRTAEQIEDARRQDEAGMFYADMTRFEKRLYAVLSGNPIERGVGRHTLENYQVPDFATQIVARYLQGVQVAKERKRLFSSGPLDANQVPLTADILRMERTRQCAVVMAAAVRLHDHRGSDTFDSLHSLQSRLMRSELPFTEPQLVALLGEWDFHDRSVGSLPCPHRPTVRAVERHVHRHGLSEEMRAATEGAIARIRSAGAISHHGAEGPPLIDRLEALLQGRTPKAPKRFEVPEEALDWLSAEGGDREAWRAFLALFRRSLGGRPSDSWLARVRDAIAVIGTEAFAARATAAIDRGRLPGLDDVGMRCLIWAASQVPEPGVAQSLARWAKAEYLRRPDNNAVANACIRALAEMGTMEAVGQLAHLRQRLRAPSAETAIEKALDRVKERTGLTDGEIEEIAVPDFGLDADGTRTVPVGPYGAVICVGDRSVDLRWRAPAGKGEEQKTVPAAVKRDHGEALAAARSVVRDVRDEFRLQRRRLEALLTTDRRWDFPTWRERYIDHPLVAPVARGLIWRVEDGGRSATAIWPEGRPVQADDTPLDAPGDGATVRLWHPVDAEPGEVAAWRDWLMRHAVRQPFKQAFRESYTPTAAELETATYSNRFAGHFLREGQFASLCRSRGWWAPRLGDFDAGGVPGKVFREAKVVAEYWIEPVRIAALQGDTGIYFYGTTDRVEFFRPGEGDSLPIDQVPPRAFSEAMRDVDLFVSVSSIGTDPTWEDRGEGGGDAAMTDYWSGYLDASLSGSAETRRAVLEAVLPRLRIADRCAIEGRHLVVRGNRLRYRINLRSAAAFAEPSGTHLCIVPGGPGRGGYERLLPFESGEDPLLATILAKAFLLAADDGIKDPTIKSQIDAAAHG